MALTKVTGDFIKDGSIAQGHLHASHGITTSDIGEGSNLYFTTARVNTAVGNLSTSDLSEGTNLYYTDARARAAISVSGNALSYNSSTGVITSNFEESPTFSGNVVINGSGSSGNALNITRGSDGSQAFRVQNAGEVVVTNNYFYAAGGGTSMYVQNTAVFRGNIVNDGTAGVVIGDDLTVNDTLFVSEYIRHSGNTNSHIRFQNNRIGIFANSGTAGYIDLHDNGNVYIGASNSTAATFTSSGVTFAGTITASGYNNSNWDTAYTYSQVGHLPLAGGTLTGQVNFSVAPFFINGVDLVFKAASGSTDPGDLVWRDGSNNERHRIWDGTNTLNYRTAGGTTYQLIHSGYSSYNNSNWDTAYGWGNHASAGYLTSYTETDTLATVTGRGASTSTAVTLSSTDNHYKGHFYWDAYNADGAHYPHFLDGSNANGVDINWRLYTGGTVSVNHLWNITKTEFRNQLHTTVDARAPIYYDRNNTGYYVDPAGTGTSIKIAGGMQANTPNGNVIIKHTVSEANSWIFQENAANWGLFWVNEGGASKAVTFGSYNTVGAELVGFRQSTATNMINPSAWTGIDSNAHAAWLLSNYSGDFWTAGTQYSAADMRAPIFYDSNNTAYYVDPNSTGTSINVRGEIANPSVWINDGNNYNNYNENIRLFNAPNSVSVIAFSASGTSGTPTTSILGYSNYLEFRRLDQWQQRLGTNYAEAYGDYRAPIFYDSNNTARYIDPTSLSVLYRIQSTSAQASPRWDTAFYVLQAQHWYGDNSSQTMFLGEGSNTIQVPGSGGIRPKIVYDYDNTNFYLNPDGTSNLSTLSTDTNEGIFNNQRRNHSTYQNFNDTGLRAGINYLQQGTNGPTGTASHQWYGWRLGLGGDYGTQTGSSGHYAQEWYIARKGQGGNSTGGNFLWTRDMEGGSWGSWHKVDTDRLQLASGYAVTMGSWGLRNVTPNGYIELGPANTSHAHIYTDRSNFYFNAQIQLLGGSLINQNDIRAQIFYDLNNTGYYTDPASNSILYDLTLTGSKHTYLYVNPGNGYEAMTRYNGGSGSTWYVGSRTSSDLIGSTDAWHVYSQTAGRTVSGTDTGGNTFAYGSSRAPIFYDSNNTGYYVDPASTSNVNVINASGQCNFTSSTYPIFVYGNGSTAGSSAVGLQVYATGSNGAIMAFHRGGSYAVNMGLDSDNVMRIGGWSASSNRWTLDMSGNNIVAGSSRAPIFYDSGNTGYYVDPASWSNLSSGRVGSYLQIGTTGNTTHTPGINMAIGSDIYWRQSTYSNNADIWMESIDNATYLTWNLKVSSFDTTSWTDSIVVFNHNFWRGYVGILRSPEYPLDLNGQARLSGGYTTSDVRLKKNIRDNELGLSHLLQLRTRLFDWITDEEILGRTLAFQNSLLDCRGFIAQEVEEVVPELVDTSEGDQPTKSIDDGAVTAMMVKAIQEQQAIIDDLKARIEILENQ